MRIVGVTIVRNEEDIVEASVRHNLRSLDALCVVDHGSDDATPAILDALAREGLPLEILNDASLELRQSEVTTGHARRLLEGGADLCVPIDADEFLCMRSRAVFERAVAAADPTLALVMPWLTYLPSFDGPGDIVQRLAHARRMPAERHGLSKVVVRRSLLDTPHARVGAGNHRIQPGDGQASFPHEALPGEVAAIAHVPVRSAAQLTAKVAVGSLAVQLADLDDRAVAFHWREEFDALLAGQPITRERLTAIVANYGVAPSHRVDPAGVEWVEDPFLAPIELRYTPATPPNPLARILTFGERVAAEVARTTGGL